MFWVAAPEERVEQPAVVQPINSLYALHGFWPVICRADWCEVERDANAGAGSGMSADARGSQAMREQEMMRRPDSR